MKIFMLSPVAQTILSQQQLNQLKQAGDFTLISKPQPFSQITTLYQGKEPRIIALDPDFCEWTVPNSLIDETPNLKAIILQGTSFSWLDIDYARKKGVTVVNLQGWSSTAVAEWAVTVLLMLARKIPLVIKSGFVTDFNQFSGIELEGKTVGIISLGKIGTKIAQKCQGMGMKVIYWSRSSTNNEFTRVSLSQLFTQADAIFPAFAKNDVTQSLITDELLKSMKPTAIFISIVHEVYNHELLVNMVKSGKLYGYGFETYESKFMQYHDNIWAGPEIAWCTKEAFDHNAAQWVEMIIKATKGEYPNKVN